MQEVMKEVISEKTKLVEKEIAGGEITLGFNKWMAEKQTDKKKSAEYLVKADQVKAIIESNKLFLEYVKTL